MQRVPAQDASRRIDEAIALVRLQGHGDKLPGQLSGGQQQRVAIARAIVIEPPLVLMDEPLSNLDAKLRLEMRAEIRRIHAMLGATTIYVTHDQEEALSLADRIVVLKDGVIRQVGTPADLFARPAHLDVAAFMGFRNAVPGRIAALGAGHATVAIGGAHLAGIPCAPLTPGASCILAVRPDDLVHSPGANDALPATALSTEFRGNDFTGFARMADGTELVFASQTAVPPGTPVHLVANPARTLIYPSSAGLAPPAPAGFGAEPP